MSLKRFVDSVDFKNLEATTSNCEYKHCTFTNCLFDTNMMRYVTFEYCKFEKCTFRCNVDLLRIGSITWTGCIFLNCTLPAEVPIVPNIHTKVLEAIEKDGCALAMDSWHKCGTTHCRAGFVNLVAGHYDSIVEHTLRPGTLAAFIYAKSHHGFPIPSFYDNNEPAMADIKSCAEKYPNPEPMV